MQSVWMSGLRLAERLYEESVRPLLARRFPHVIYSAALVGRGSDVLGFDTPQSVDHDWGPRLMLFLAKDGYDEHRSQIDQLLRQELPVEICGYPTNYSRYDDGTRVIQAVKSGPVNHAVTIHALRDLVLETVGYDLDNDLTILDWLTFPEQCLRALTAGRVFHDGLGQLVPLRERLSYYPHDVWLYLLACQWNRIAQEEAFMGRCGQVGDELGSSIVASRLVRDVMRLCFLVERQYAPYTKWLGSAFAQLECAPQLTPALQNALHATSWQDREESLNSAYEMVARMNNDLGITNPLPTRVSPFHSRPFSVIHGERFANAIREAITSPEIRALPRNLGGIDQYVDATDVLERPDRFSRLKVLYW